MLDTSEIWKEKKVYETWKIFLCCLPPFGNLKKKRKKKTKTIDQTKLCQMFYWEAKSNFTLLFICAFVSELEAVVHINWSKNTFQSLGIYASVFIYAYQYDCGLKYSLIHRQTFSFSLSWLLCCCKYTHKSHIYDFLWLLSHLFLLHEVFSFFESSFIT